jgi:hypothetical protein
MNKKGAYEEVKNRRCPLADNLSTVISKTIFSNDA